MFARPTVSTVVFGRPARRRSRRRLLRLVTALLLAACAALLPTAWLGVDASEPRPLEAGATVQGRVEVRDGDTLVVGGVPVRLAGLHCPERGQSGGAAATARMRALVARQPVACRLTGDRTFDRQVGICRTADRDLAEILIREGTCARCPRHNSEGRYREAQSSAGPWRGSLPRYC